MKIRKLLTVMEEIQEDGGRRDVHEAAAAGQKTDRLTLLTALHVFFQM